MPGCSPLQVTPNSSVAPLLFSQVSDKAGLNSRSAGSEATNRPARPALLASTRAANPAGRDAAAAWHGRYQEWMEADACPRTRTDLFARLPFDDAVNLAALVGTGQMTWPEVNAALDAMIKLAAAEALDGRGDEHHSVQAPHPAEQIAEKEIWARYHAQCDEVFASDANAAAADQRSAEELWRTERILDRLRSARDRDLAESRRRFGARLSRSISVVQMSSLQTAMLKVQLTPPEREAIHQLDATGFVASGEMEAAIDRLASEVARGVDRRDEPEQQALRA
jgi:hypothetical protein